jgi:hypothetical protein
MRYYQVDNNKVVIESDDAAQTQFPDRWTFLYETVEERAKPVFLISPDAFWQRFLQSERVNLDLAQQHDPAATNPVKRAAARYRVLTADIGTLKEVNLKSTRIDNFVRGMETDAIIAVGRADTILTAPATASELP